MTEPPAGNPQRDDHHSTDPAPQRASSGLRFTVWFVVTVVLLVYVAFGSMPAVFYTYNAFLRQVNRHVDSRTLLDIWTSEMTWLSSISTSWLLDAAFAGSALIMLAGVVTGAWLLLVRSRDGLANGRFHRTTRNHAR